MKRKKQELQKLKKIKLILIIKEKHWSLKFKKMMMKKAS